MSIVRLKQETDGERIITIVNTRADELAQLATNYTPFEIGYFRKVVEVIMIAPNYAYSASSGTVLSSAKKVQGTFSKTSAEALLKQWTAQGWLELSPCVLIRSHIYSSCES